MLRPAAPLALLLLAGCARDTGSYPSLAPRAVEKQSFAEPVRPIPAVIADPALDAHIAGQGVDLDRIAAAFTTAAARARRDAETASHQPVGSEAWLTAQTALAKLDDWRAQASAMAADVEAQGSARAAKLLPAYPALEALRTRATAETDREAAATSEIQALVPAA